MNIAARLLVYSLCVLPLAICAVPQPPTPVSATMLSTAASHLASYPDSESGLTKLMKDLLHATRSNDSASVHALLQNMLPVDREAWFQNVFGEDGPQMLKEQQRSPQVIERDLAEFFHKMIRENFMNVMVFKHEATCDVNSGENIYPVLFMRQAQVPLYDVRFNHGTQFYRLWALAYSDGGFRFVGNLQVPQSFRAARAPAGTLTGEPGKRIVAGGRAMATKLTKEVGPTYPEDARLQRLQGTVRLRALIDTDGMIQQLRVVSGFCSLAQASIEAVRQWRYTPTLVEGEPVEVETFIEVIFRIGS